MIELSAPDRVLTLANDLPTFTTGLWGIILQVNDWQLNLEMVRSDLSSKMERRNSELGVLVRANRAYLRVLSDVKSFSNLFDRWENHRGVWKAISVKLMISQSRVIKQTKSGPD